MNSFIFCRNFKLASAFWFFVWGLTSALGQDVRLEGWTPSLTDTFEFKGRKIERFEHGSAPGWNAKDPKQTDYFYVLTPRDGVAEGRPLYIALHSAGGSGQEELEWRASHDVHNIYVVPDDFYGLFVDCGANRATDWWWGGRPATESEIDEHNADKSTTELQPVEKRVMAEIAWTIKEYKINPERVYLCGNSMGGSGTLGLGLRHGDVFAAVKANVPAGIWHAYDRLQLGSDEEYADLPDPPVCLDYSAPNDDWSARHEVLFDRMEARKYSYIAYWGNFGHENVDEKVAVYNDLFNTFDWTSVRRDAAYPVFTKASTDDPCPWPERKSDTPAGQRGAYFRWTNRADSSERFEIELRLASAEELQSKLFDVPTSSVADVTLRRLQKFVVRPNDVVEWKFGDRSGKVVVDRGGLITISGLTIDKEPCVLTLKKGQ